MADIFLSYASADRERARTLADAFARCGLGVWWDRTIPPGRVFDEVIQEALHAARCVVVLWSATSVRSNWVKAEASEALARNRLVPVLIDEAPPPFEFKRIQAANLAGWRGDPADPEFVGLLSSVERLIARPSDQPSTTTIRPVTPPPSAAGSRGRWTALALAAVVALAGAAYVAGIMPGARRDTPRGTVAVEAADRPAAPGAGRVNLLAAENGGELLSASNDSWKKTVDGDERTYGRISYSAVGKADATFGFKDGRAATFDTVAVLIPARDDYNVRQFEVLAGDDGPLGPFRSIGVFTVANTLLAKSPFQPFTFAPITAKLVRIRPLSAQAENGDLIVYEWQLLGRLEGR